MVAVVGLSDLFQPFQPRHAAILPPPSTAAPPAHTLQLHTQLQHQSDDALFVIIGWFGCFF